MAETVSKASPDSVLLRIQTTPTCDFRLPFVEMQRRQLLDVNMYSTEHLISTEKYISATQTRCFHLS